jgi:signal peptidase I
MFFSQKKTVKNNQTWAEWFREMVILLSVIFLIRTFGFGLYQVPSGSMETTMLEGERFFADKLSYWFVKPKRLDIISFNAPGGDAPPHFKYATHPLKRFWQKFFYGPDNWTKRVIGLPGETIRGVLEEGRPVIYITNKDGETKLDQSAFVNKYPLVLTGEGYLERIKQRKFKSFNPDIKDARGNIAFDGPGQFYRIDIRTILANAQGEMILRLPATPVDVHGDLDRNDRCTSDVFEITLADDEYWVMGDNRLGSYDSRMWGPIKSEMIHGKIVFRIWSIDSDEAWWIVDLIKHPIDFWKRMRWSRCLQLVK